MDKQVVLVLGLLALASQCYGHTKDEVSEAIKSFGSSCDPPPTDADVEALMNHDENPPKTVKCFMNCLAKQTSMLVDGKIDVDMLKNFLSMAYEGNEKEIENIGEECNKATQNPDECELAFEYNVCVMKGMEANGMEIKKL